MPMVSFVVDIKQKQKGQKSVKLYVLLDSVFKAAPEIINAELLQKYYMHSTGKCKLQLCFAVFTVTQHHLIKKK